MHTATPTPEEVLLRDELRMQLLTALDALDPEERLLLRLRFWRGADVDERRRASGLRGMRVLQTERLALRKLRAALEAA